MRRMEKIAIVGMSCLFPGAHTLDSFWLNLISGLKSTTPADKKHTGGADPSYFYDPDQQSPDTTYFLEGGHINDFQFDPRGYLLSADTLLQLDDTVKWSLYTARQALLDSGIMMGDSRLQHCGLLMGALTLPTKSSYSWLRRWYESSIESGLHELLGIRDGSLAQPDLQPALRPENALIAGYPVALVAQALGLNGVHFSLDAACASAVYSVSLACKYLSTGKADLMLAGAVSAADPLFVNMGFATFEAYPNNNRNHPLDASSQGLISSEGAGMIVLKRYTDALKDEDKIYAIVDGIGLANDGRGKHVLTPNSKGQILAFERAYQSSTTHPSDVQYIECHASGTPLGDKTELNSMEAFFEPYEKRPLIGSVKANVGHLLTAAGMASIIKTVLSMDFGVIPATPGIQDPLTSQNNLFNGSTIVQRNSRWPGSNDQIKRVGINAFGFGGVSAHMVLQNNQAISSNEQPIEHPSLRMAIVGMDAHFGGAEGLASFEQTIYDGIQHFVPLTGQRWKGMEAELTTLKSSGLPELEQIKGAFIDQFDIDFMRYKLPPNNEEQLIPQQLLLLKVADNAIKDAKLVTGSNVAVIVAIGSELSLHQARARIDLGWQVRKSDITASLKPQTVKALESVVKDSLHAPAEVNHYTSHIGNIISSRVSALWDFSGPAFTVSAEENSVFRALEVAQILLSNNEVDAVVLGAVDLAGGVESVLTHSQFAPLNTGALTFSFDRNAHGWQIGEGAGAIVLKSFEPDQRTEAYAIVESVVFAQSDEPRADMVVVTVNEALREANISAGQVGYVEACGSGFGAIDAVEMEGLANAYAGSSNPTCAIGSVKANIGHTFVASGIASLIKSALCLHKRIIPAVPNWTGPKQLELWQNTPFYVPTKSKTWFPEHASQRRYATVNSIGFDHSHVHVVLGESSETRPYKRDYLQISLPKLFVVVGFNANDLAHQLDELESQSSLQDLASLAQWLYTRYLESANVSYVLSLLARTTSELQREIGFARQGIVESFQSGTDWSTPQGSSFSPNPLGPQGKVAFVYPGAFNAYPRLGQDLFQLFPETYSHMEGVHSELGKAFADHLITPRSQEKITRKDWGKVRDRLESNPVAMMEAGISFSVLYTRILNAYFGVHADSAFGYSLGEGSMLWSLGVWTDGAKASQEMHASPLFTGRLGGRMNTLREIWGLDEVEDNIWSAYFISAPANVVASALELETRVFLTHINTHNEVMIAGRPEDCERIVASIGYDNMRAPFSVIIHCEAVLPEYQSFYRMHHFPVTDHPSVTFYSAANYSPTSLTQNVLAHNMARIVCKPVDFPRLVNRVYADGARIFIELGPRSTCTRWINESLQDKAHLALSINTPGVDDITGIMRLIAKMVSHRVQLDLSVLFARDQVATETRRTLIQTVTLGGEPIRETIVRQGSVLLATPQVQSGITTTANEIASKDVSPDALSTLTKRNITMRSAGQQLLNTIANLLDGVTVSLPVQEQTNEQVSPVTLSNSEKPALYNLKAIEEFATGSVSACFGERYHVYDNVRAPRVPNGDLLLISRVLSIKGVRFKSEPGTEIITEYDVPVNAWFYRDNAYPEMPYSVMMEIALQPCGFLSAYHGPTLDFPDIDFYFRNLDGQGKLLRSIDLRGKTITNQVTMVNSTTMQGIIIQKFEFKLMHDDIPFYVGDATFGYFTLQSLASQAGLDRGQTTQPWYVENKIPSVLLPIGDGPNTLSLRSAVGQKDYNHLPVGQLDFLDEVLVIPHDGKHGLGYVYGVRQVDPRDWYFNCHFYQDPVMPGSLGVEAIMQSLQVFAIQSGVTARFANPHFEQMPDHNTMWRYRGQVLSASPRIYLEVNITELKEDAGRTLIIGNANLWRHDFLRIYEIKGVSLAVLET